jgi:hypothetical protein
MQISALLIGLALLGGALLYVTLPFRQKARKVGNSSDATHSEVHREEILLALRGLDFDFKTGKVSEDDYQPLRAQLMSEAAQYMESEKKQDDQLEALIQSRRRAQPQQAFCPSCGQKIYAGDVFCSSCGAKVEIRAQAVAG